MNRIDTSDIVDPNIQQPYTGRSLKFFQDSVEVQITYALIALIGDSYSAATPYCLSACQYTGSVSTPSTIAGGYIFYDTKIYPAQIRSTPITLGSTYTLVQSQDIVADPLQFTDGNYRNVHDIFTMVPTDNTLGSGLFDLADLVQIHDDRIAKITPSLLTSFTAATPISYYKDINGWVHFNGQLQKAQGSGTSIFMNLPAGYRPTALKRIATTNVDNATPKADHIQIQTTGDVSVGNNTAGGAINTIFHLDGMSFFTGW